MKKTGHLGATDTFLIERVINLAFGNYDIMWPTPQNPGLGLGHFIRPTLLVLGTDKVAGGSILKWLHKDNAIAVNMCVSISAVSSRTP